MPTRLRQALTTESIPAWRRLLLCIVAVSIPTIIWFPCVQFFVPVDVDDYVAADGVAPRAKALAARHLAMWGDPDLRAAELAKMRGSNAEWDFMGRTFLVLALANMSYREPAQKAQYLEIIDAIIDDTLAVEREKGMTHFLMPYARSGQYHAQPPRSLFLDGEIALMLAVRRLVEEKPGCKRLLHQRIEIVMDSMQSGPILCAESYPNECWTFDHCMALAAITIADAVDGTDRSAFGRKWLEIAKGKLVHEETGILASAYTLEGVHLHGPEGSTIWMTAHCLELIDEEFARDQYDRARKELGRTLLGFGYAREWPPSWDGYTDIDSGPIIPVLGISAGSSGMALIGSSAFGDRAFLRSLLATLEFGAFPVEEDGTLRYCASNQVGDAAMLYAMVQGPLWREVKQRLKR